MKKIIYIISFLILSLTGFSQETLWSVTYQMAFPDGELSDFTGKTSFRGFGVEGRAFVDNNVSIGGGAHWNVFYERKDKITTEIDNVTITGTHFNYVNAFPFYANAAYYFNEGSYFRPYMAMNAGVIYAHYRKDVGLYRIDDQVWKFSLAPEIGVLIETYDRANFTVNFRYNYGVETAETTPLGYFGINVGVIWLY
jgi:hypothetical protein